MNQSNSNVFEVTKSLLFEQYKSAVNAYDSSQDSLDKAYLAIVFGDIAFYATKINLANDSFWFNLVAISYMAISLVLILFSFALSKLAMSNYKETLVYQIGLLVLPEDEQDRDDVKRMEGGQTKIDRMNGNIRQLNWHVPVMVFFSSSLCFIKVSFTQKFQIDIIGYLAFSYLISSIFICLYLKRKSR